MSMSQRPVYLAKSGLKSQRAHFSIFIPNDGSETLGDTFKNGPCTGTVVHVVGEPLMAGYALEIKRNHDCTSSHDLRQLLLLGHVDENHLFDSEDTREVKESTARCRFEAVASQIQPPPKGQNIRAPIDGITTKRCQEWTMEFLKSLVEQKLINEEAVVVAQAERDAPTYGIFGRNPKS